VPGGSQERFGMFCDVRRLKLKFRQLETQAL